jgi:simple sugar transport system substrate-binding protein/ribose transport system substrate-binding protein
MGGRWRRMAGILAAGATAMTVLAACGGTDPGTSDASIGTDEVKLGFSQVGSESGWRDANTKSIQDSARDAGIKLEFHNANQKQDAQIAAIRSYIKAKVDVIAFSPVVSTGWDQVLGEAKKAKIPVVITDRTIDTQDKTLYTTFIGSDFPTEGKKAGDWLIKEYAGKPAPVSIVELEGTAGSAPTIDRKQGFANAIAADPKFTVTVSQTADFTRQRGKEVMAGILKTTPRFDVLFAQNDDMGLGAIEALEAAGLKPGVDVKIVTVDAIRDGMAALAAGKINFIVECSPLLGPQLMDVVKKIKRGESVPPVVVTEETTFTQEQAKAALSDRKY